MDDGTKPHGDYKANCYMNILNVPNEDGVAFDDDDCNVHSTSYYCQSVKTTTTTTPVPPPTPAPTTTTTTTADPLVLGGTNDPKAKNLPVCVGECDADSQCKTGLKCFQRTGLTPVPGCKGAGSKDWDYCYDPKGSATLSGGNAGGATNLFACTGECDADSQCKAGLKCFQRSNSETIPGCTGAGSGKDWDYCYDPKWKPGTVTVVPVALGGTNDAKAKNLPACVGECDADSQCKAGLKCFQRTGLTPVPGCTGTGSKDWDYCYDPKGSKTLSGGNVGGAKNLATCTGECDADSQCASGLKCFQRSNGETIPGCSGAGSGKDWDYCYDPKWTR